MMYPRYEFCWFMLYNHCFIITESSCFIITEFFIQLIIEIITVYRGIVSKQYIVTVNVHSLLWLYIIHIIMEIHIFQGKY